MKQWNLFYKKPAACWIEALPLGNGHIGAMVYGGEKKDRISLNLDTLWSGTGKNKGNEHSERKWDKIRNWILNEQFSEAEEYIKENVLGDWTESYMPAGNLWIQVNTTEDAEVKQYERKLNLNTAIYENTYEIDGKNIKKEMFTSMEKKIMAIKITTSQDSSLDINVNLDTLLCCESKEYEAESAFLLIGRAPVYAAPNYYETKDPIRYEEGKGIRFALGVQAETKEGTVEKSANGIHVKGTREVILYFSGATDFYSQKKNDNIWLQEMKKTLVDAKTVGYENLKKEHVRVQQSYFERVELELGEETQGMETVELVKNYDLQKENQYLPALLFHYGRYLLIAASAPQSQCANLQGIWNEDLQAPWSSNYTVNINTEMNYWMAESCHLSEFHEPLFTLIERMAKCGEKTAKELYGLEGWVSHHNIDLWGHTTPVGRYADSAESCVYSMWNMSSGWLCRHLWEHYLYTLDIVFLQEKAFPIIEGAVKFYLGYLVSQDGYLMTIPSTSPENMFQDKKGEAHSVAEASTMDISILKELFSYYVEACEILNLEGLKEQVKETLKLLPPFKIGNGGQLQEWYKDWEECDVHHRHVSHLYGLYPANIISEEQAELRKACEVVLNRRGDEGTGWCIVWKACLWARLKDGNRALQLLSNQMRFTCRKEVAVVGGGTYPNLFCAHPPFQIDGNFGYTAAVTEMLIQSQEGKIELLPALPDAWKDGKVKGLKARGGYEVSFEWNEHKIVALDIKAKKPGSVVVKYNGVEKRMEIVSTL